MGTSKQWAISPHFISLEPAPLLKKNQRPQIISPGRSPLIPQMQKTNSERLLFDEKHMLQFKSPVFSDVTRRFFLAWVLKAAEGWWKRGQDTRIDSH